jgi:hypothetical protein
MGQGMPDETVSLVRTLISSYLLYVQTLLDLRVRENVPDPPHFIAQETNSILFVKSFFRVPLAWSSLLIAFFIAVKA